MKKIAITLVILCTFFVAFAQEEEKEVKPNSDQPITLLGRDRPNRSHGGYFGLMLQYNEIEDLQGMNLGIRMGWIMNHSFSMGLIGEGFFTEPQPSPTLNDGYDYTIGGGWAGFYMEPIFAARLPVHITAPISFGIGALSYTRDIDHDWENWENWEDWEGQFESNDLFIIIKPGVELELNLLKFIRLNLGAYYRMTSEVKLKDANDVQIFDDKMLNGLSYGITLKFGKF